MSTGVMARQSTSVILDVGPILDSTGAEFTTASIADLTLSKNGSRAAMSGNTFTHAGNGHYSLTLTTANTDTLGVIQISCNRATYQMPVKERQIVPAAVYDAIVLGTDVLTADVIQIGGDAQSGTDLKDFVDAGYDPTTNKVNAELDSASRLAIWNTLTTETFTADSFGELLIISDGTNGREVKVTGANHIAADVHDCQADGLSASTEIINIQNASGYLLAVLAGACADPQTASETYAITVFGSTFTVDMAGQTSTGTRTAPTLTKT